MVSGWDRPFFKDGEMGGGRGVKVRAFPGVTTVTSQMLSSARSGLMAFLIISLGYWVFNSKLSTSVGVACPRCHAVLPG